MTSQTVPAGHGLVNHEAGRSKTPPRRTKAPLLEAPPLEWFTHVHQEAARAAAANPDRPDAGFKTWWRLHCHAKITRQSPPVVKDYAVNWRRQMPHNRASVLWVIFDHCSRQSGHHDGERRAFLNVKTIALEAKRSERTVKRVLRAEKNAPAPLVRIISQRATAEERLVNGMNHFKCLVFEVIFSPLAFAEARDAARREQHERDAAVYDSARADILNVQKEQILERITPAEADARIETTLRDTAAASHVPYKALAAVDATRRHPKVDSVTTATTTHEPPSKGRTSGSSNRVPPEAQTAPMPASPKVKSWLQRPPPAAPCAHCGELVHDDGSGAHVNDSGDSAGQPHVCRGLHVGMTPNDSAPMTAGCTS